MSTDLQFARTLLIVPGGNSMLCWSELKLVAQSVTHVTNRVLIQPNPEGHGDSRKQAKTTVDRTKPLHVTKSQGRTDAEE